MAPPEFETGEAVALRAEVEGGLVGRQAGQQARRAEPRHPVFEDGEGPHGRGVHGGFAAHVGVGAVLEDDVEQSGVLDGEAADDQAGFDGVVARCQALGELLHSLAQQVEGVGRGLAE